MRVLTWNLFHGRAVPDRPRDLQHEFTELLASWSWDVALLQEVPPWWPVPLGRACRASARSALTWRNTLLPLRRALAQWRPDLIKSNGGGCNAILVRDEPIREHRVQVLRRLPERRVVHAVRLDELWIANVHAQVRPHTLTRADLDRAGEAVRAWADVAPTILAGDCNVPDPAVEGFVDAGGHGVDRVLLRGLSAIGRARTLERHGLSDHAPVLLDVALGKESLAGGVH